MSIENIRQILDIQAIDFQVIQNNNNNEKMTITMIQIKKKQQ